MLFFFLLKRVPQKLESAKIEQSRVLQPRIQEAKVLFSLKQRSYLEKPIHQADVLQ